MELCLFDAAGVETRIPVPWRSLYVWHAYIPGLGPGQRYGWRVQGPFAPSEGHRFNPHKLVLDPYARAVAGSVDYRGPVFGYPRDRGASPDVLDDRDDAAFKPKGVVVDDTFAWGDDRAPCVPWNETELYELHVRGFTKMHPGVPEALRGTYLGLASDAAIEHLKSLGVTTVELMPIHQHLDEPPIVARGMTNYWGYSTLSFFAPDTRFATRGGDAVREFKEMVKRLHAAGIEVVLDVVYNHTCEGDAEGPTVSMRGIDNRVYYRLASDDPSEYIDYSGCGNTLDATHPQVLKLVTDSLRYWVTEMHVDGFRFDLAAALARGAGGRMDGLSAFFAVVHQDPVLSRIKLIAEPWDVAADGYQVGNFPILWSEWNGRFRDTVRSFWRGDRKAVADLGYRMTGSSDLFADDGRHPHASINLITAHDGFTLRDLVSYEKKHNEANGEGNKDGWDDNRSQNCGARGRGISVTTRVLACRAHPRAQPDGDALRRAGRADDRDGRRAVAHAAREQQPVLSRLRADLGRLGPGPRRACDARARAQARDLAQGACGLPPARFPHGQGHHVAPSRGRRDDAARLARTGASHAGVSPDRARGGRRVRGAHERRANRGALRASARRLACRARHGGGRPARPGDLRLATRRGFQPGPARLHLKAPLFQLRERLCVSKSRRFRLWERL